MKTINYISAIGLVLFSLTACQNEAEDITPQQIYTVGEANNAIVLRAGLNEVGAGVLTRAVDDNHAPHLPFIVGTKLALKIDGTWTGHSPSADIVMLPTATIGSKIATKDNKHNEVTDITPSVYWDDFGTADPNNMGDGNGRAKGLTIYGVAVNGETAARTVSDWSGYPWTLEKNQTSGWEAKDLLTSNNISEGKDGTYKFDDTTPSNLLEFTHAMSKITVNLKAGKGFTDNQFVADPTVTVFDTYLSGTIDVISGTTVPKTAAADPKDKIQLAKCATTVTDYTVSYDGLVMPGNAFEDAADILKVEADGNTYYVTAAKINEANTAAGDVFERGKNYVLNIVINKTEIQVNATVVEWSTVEAEQVAPEINVVTPYAGSGTATKPTGFTSFSLYRSASDPTASPAQRNDLSGYSSTSTELVENGYYKPEAIPTGSLGSTTKWTITKPLYWPNHSTHYHFRGVWPNTVTKADTDYSDETYDWVAPRVHNLSAEDATQVIDLKNVAYAEGTNPSDLLIGMPEIAAGTTCDTHANHVGVDQSLYGICATKGVITLNFRYVMSQVEIELKTSTDASKVNIDDETEVQIVNVANTGYVRLGDRTVVSANEVTGTYLMDVVSGSPTKRNSAIVPQTLAYSTPGADSNVRFKITITNEDGTTDVYYADINPILKKGTTTGEKVAPNGKWESGYHYKYELYLTKTEIKVSATITDWLTVTAEENVWF